MNVLYGVVDVFYDTDRGMEADGLQYCGCLFLTSIRFM